MSVTQLFNLPVKTLRPSERIGNLAWLALLQNGQLPYPCVVQLMNDRGKSASYRELITSSNSMNFKPMFILLYNSGTIFYDTITTAMLKEWLIDLAALRLLFYSGSYQFS